MLVQAHPGATSLEVSHPSVWRYLANGLFFDVHIQVATGPFYLLGP